MPKQSMGRERSEPAVKGVLDGMQARPNDADLQEEACKSLLKLGSSKIISREHEKMAVHAVCKAMATFPSSSSYNWQQQSSFDGET
jgi:hypothetical protein